METTQAYSPRAGSVADRVMTYLSTVPERWAFGEELADACDTDASSLHGALSTAERFGAVHKDLFNLKTRWHLGPKGDPAQGVQAARDAATEHLADKDAGQPAAALLIPKFTRDTPTTWNPSPTDALPLPPAGPEFACARFNDGRLLIELGDMTIRLTAAHASTLAAYLAAQPKGSRP